MSGMVLVLFMVVWTKVRVILIQWPLNKNHVCILHKIDSNYLEYDETANSDDGSCSCVNSVEINLEISSENPLCSWHLSLETILLILLQLMNS